MRLLATTITLFLFALQSGAQLSGGGQLNAYDISGKPMTLKGPVMEGSPMLNSNLGKGMVKFKNGAWVNELELQFNLLENELYYRQNNQTFSFVDSIQEFTLAFEEEGVAHSAIFRSGYPPMGKYKSEAFYEVLADGKQVQLLKSVTKVLVEKNSYGRGMEKEYKQTIQLYLYDVAIGEIIRIKKDKKSLMEALPAYTKRIEELANSTKNKLRTEEEVAELVKLLNH